MIKLKTPHNKKMYLVANYRWLSLLAVFSSICAKEIESEVKCLFSLVMAHGINTIFFQVNII